MAYPRDHITKKVQDEKKIMEIIDNFCDENPNQLADPRVCWLDIREKLLEEGLINDSRDNEVLAKSYFTTKAMGYSPELETYEEYEKER